MSGWMNTRTSGTRAIAHSLTTSWTVAGACRISDRLAASITIRPIFANSDGVTWNPAISNHRCAPACDEPRNDNRTSSRETIIPA